MKVLPSQTTHVTSFAAHSESIDEKTHLTTLSTLMHRCINVADSPIAEKQEVLSDAQKLKLYPQQGCQVLLSHLDKLSSEDLPSDKVKVLSELICGIEALEQKYATVPNFLTIAGNLKNTRNVADGM